jgi:hypothetical protein
MPRAKKGVGSQKFAALPANYRKLSQVLTWDPDDMPLLVGTVAGFGESPAKDFKDGKWYPGKTQRFVKIAPDDSDKDIVYVVYLSGQLMSLADLGEGEHVAIACTGVETVEGFRNPVRQYEVGVG